MVAIIGLAMGADRETLIGDDVDESSALFAVLMFVTDR